MTDIFRQRRPEIAAFNPAIATLAVMQIGTSVALAKQQQAPVAQPVYSFESTVSPDAQRLEHEVGRLLGRLRSHNAVSDAPESMDAPESVEAPVSRTHVSRATSAASTMPDLVLSADDFTLVMSTRTRFPRSFDVDSEE